MKPDAKKQSKPWLWITIALLALIAIVGVVLAMLTPPQPSKSGITPWSM
jgi:hypothetical protein